MPSITLSTSYVYIALTLTHCLKRSYFEAKFLWVLQYCWLLSLNTIYNTRPCFTTQNVKTTDMPKFFSDLFRILPDLLEQPARTRKESHRHYPSRGDHLRMTAPLPIHHKIPKGVFPKEVGVRWRRAATARKYSLRGFRMLLLDSSAFSTSDLSE